MSDLLGSIGEGLGKAFDFVTPTTERRGAGFGWADLVNTAADVGRNSIAGGVSAIDDILASEGSAREKLFTTALIGAGAAGTALGARQLAGARKIERQMVPPIPRVNPALTRWTPEAGAVGLMPRYAADSPEGAAIVRTHPGVRPRTADILGAPDFLETAARLGRREIRQQPEQAAKAAAIISTYAEKLGDVPPEARLGAAQLDFAKVDTAFDGGLLNVSQAEAKAAGFLNAEFNNLWRKFQDSPTAMSDLEVESFTSYVQQIGDATRHITEPDLSFDLVAKVERIDLTPSGPVLRVKVPDWDSDSIFTNAEVRSERIRNMNLRPLAARGKSMMKRLYELGVKEQEVPGTLPRPLEKGSGWYPKANTEIMDAFPQLDDVPWATPRKLIAAVSLTSEAEKWEGNVALAVSALKRSNTPEVLDPDFQAWLQDGTFRDAAQQLDRRTYTGARADEHRATFRRLHDEAKRGNQLDEKTYKKVLRLAVEEPSDVFLSTSGKKQKNFYLNLADPEDPGPVTIDRHMHDVFFGLATSSDFKLLEGNDLGDANYDLIADTLRELADELQVAPNEIQGVVWEAWKALKEGHKSGGSYTWPARNPFRLMEEDGSENIVYQALQGRHGTNVATALEKIPTTLPFITGGKGRGLYTMPDDSLGVLGPVDPATAASVRHLYPAFVRQDDVALWGAGAPRRVLDLESHRNMVDGRMSGHATEMWGPGAFPGGHPATLPQNTIAFDVPDGPLPKGVQALGKLVDPGMPASTTRPARMLVRLREHDIDAATFADPDRSPLTTHAWVAMEAAVNEEQVARLGIKETDNARRLNMMMADLRREGYHPILQSGVYDGVSNPSVLVFGMSAEDGLKLGAKYHQESIASPAGLLYTDAAPAELRGTFRPADGIEHNVPTAADGYSETTLNGEQFRWTLTGLDWDDDALQEITQEVLNPRASARARRLFLTVPHKDAHRIHEIADELDTTGARTTAVYAPGAAPKGWKGVREHVYQDAVNTMVVRSADPELTSRHGFSAWVREGDAAGLPKANPEGSRVRTNPQVSQLPDGSLSIDGLAVIRAPEGVTPTPNPLDAKLNGRRPSHIVLRQGTVPELIPSWSEAPEGDFVAVARVSGNSLVLDADPADLTSAATFVDVMGDIGFDPSRIRVNVGSEAVKAEFVKPKVRKGFASTIFGDEVPQLRQTGNPLGEWRSKYGFDFDPAWRDGRGKIQEIPAAHLVELDNVTARFMDAHGEYARIAGMKLFGLTREQPVGLKNAVAWFTQGDGAAIHLHGPSWENPAQMAATRQYDVETGWIGVNLPPTGGAYVAHEFGHLVHYALRQSFRRVQDADAFEKAVLKKMMQRLGPTGVRKQVSAYGELNLEEFLAETISEAIYADSPRVPALQVYEAVTKQFAENSKYRRKVGWGS